MQTVVWKKNSKSVRGFTTELRLYIATDCDVGVQLNVTSKILWLHSSIENSLHVARVHEERVSHATGFLVCNVTYSYNSYKI